MPVLTRGALLCLAVAGVAGHMRAESASPSPSASYSVTGVALPGAAPGGVFMDYIAYDAARHRVWIPAGNTGSVAVIDAKTDSVTPVTGFPTTEVERGGRKRTVGPSSASVGEGVVFVGNRGDSSVCGIGAVSLVKGACLTLDSMPDGVAYVAATKEVWVTTPRDKSIRILDASKPGALTAKAKVAFDGEPEGYAVDNARGTFFTNLEDKDRTLAIDVRSRKTVKTWLPQCGEDGPKGLALEAGNDFLVVACSDHVEVLDAGHDGQILSKLDTGAGVDNIDYVASRRELFAAASAAARLTIARLDAQGHLTAAASVDTAKGARNAVATEAGVAYLTDSPEGKVLVVRPATR